MEQEKKHLVEISCGKAAAQYLVKKHRGGKAGGDGVLYETWYAIYHIALLVKEFILEKKESALPVLATQTCEFVDDFLIDLDEGRLKKHYQLKNSSGTSWNAGCHPISEDFRLQKCLNEALGVGKTFTILVTSDYEKAARLLSSIPADISSFTSVDGFAFASTLNQALQVEPKLHNAIASLCVNDDLDKVEKLGSLLVGAWVGNSGTSCKLRKLWESVIQHEPNYIKVAPEVETLEKFDETLMQIKGFSYTVEKGFFEWSFLDLDSGLLEYPVNSKKFIEFQHVVIKEGPSTFEELERHLI